MRIFLDSFSRFPYLLLVFFVPDQVPEVVLVLSDGLISLSLSWTS